MLPANFIYITIPLSLFGYFYYLRDIYRGKNKPNLISWFLWMLAPIIGAFFQIMAGAGLSALPVFMAGFGPSLVVIFSIFNKNAYWKISTLDIYCGVLSAFALVLYSFTHSLDISIIFAILSDALASVPVLIKSYKFPETETATVYMVAIFNNILGLLIIKEWSFTIYSFGIWLVLFNLLMVFVLYRKKIKS